MLTRLVHFHGGENASTSSYVGRRGSSLQCDGLMHGRGGVGAGGYMRWELNVDSLEVGWASGIG